MCAKSISQFLRFLASEILFNLYSFLVNVAMEIFANQIQKRSPYAYTLEELRQLPPPP